MPAPKTPSVTLALDPPREIVFNYGRLEAIELATNKSVVEVFQELASMLPSDAKPGERFTADQAQELCRKARWSTIAPFVAGCLGVKMTDLVAHVPLGKAWECFGKLLEPFAEAVQLLTAGETETVPPLADPDGATGPASAA